MAHSEYGARRPGIVELAISDGALKRSLLTAFVVGTLLSAINQGDVILAGASPSLLKIALNFFVPYCVATYGAVSAKRAALRRMTDTGQAGHGP